MNQEIVEALKSAQDVLSFLRHNIDPDDENSAFEIRAADGFADTLCAMLDDAEERVSMALDGLELVVGG